MVAKSYRLLLAAIAAGFLGVVVVALIDTSIITAVVGQDKSVARPHYVGAETCAGCHQDVADLWNGSHHDWALKPATAGNVFGDFEEATFDIQGLTSRFFRRDGAYFVETDGPDGSPTEFEIKYAVGIENVQQYLVELEGGKLQALDVAWDMMRERWFHLYPGRVVTSDDGFHWTGPYKNWQARCAVCHQTDFHKNYDPASQTYASTWSELNVQCEACHGPGEAHVALASDPSAFDAALFSGIGKRGLSITFEAANPDAEIQLCATCHSRREPIIADSVVAGSKFADDHRLALLRDDLYFPDGQAKDEVFVHGSFLQSKMFDRGVRCTDCHDPHSGKLLATGNAVCTQCHNPIGNERFPTLVRAAYDSTEHHFHKMGSEGAKCTTCHMPARDFLIVDPRRDHSFKVPRPDISAKIGTPNACTACHAEKTDAWAAAQVASWRPNSRMGQPHFAELFNRARGGVTEATRRRLLDTAADKSKPAIVRATALDLLRAGNSPDTAARTTPLLQDENALIRAAAGRLQRGMPPADRVRRLTPLLSDPARSVRIGAARELVDLPPGRLPPEVAAALSVANRELRASLLARADFPETHLNIAGLAVASRNNRAAVQALRTALDMDPQLSSAWLFLARILIAGGRAEDSQRALEDAVAANPGDGILHQSLGNVFLQTGRPRLAVRPFTRAADLLPANLGVQIDLGRTYQNLRRYDEALEAFEKARVLAPVDPEVLYSLSSLYIELGDSRSARRYAAELAARHPRHPLNEQLRRILPR